MTSLVSRGQTLSAVAMRNKLERVWKFSQVFLCNVRGNSGQGVKPQPSLKCVQAVPAYEGVKYNLRRRWRRVGDDLTRYRAHVM